MHLDFIEKQEKSFSPKRKKKYHDVHDYQGISYCVSNSCRLLFPILHGIREFLAKEKKKEIKKERYVCIYMKLTFVGLESRYTTNICNWEAIMVKLRRNR